MGKSSIQWTEQTWNVMTGCTPISDGCDNCYAKTLAETRLKHVYTRHLPVLDTEANRADPFAPRFWENRLNQPLSWREPSLVFANSMSDVFHAHFTFDQIARVFDVMNRAERHTFQVLTKRPERALRYADRLTWTPNIWIGTSVENMRVQSRIDLLRAISAASVRFISAEPLLEHLTLDLRGIDWLIVGGESGSKARPFNLAWARDLVAQSRAAGVAPFVKQLGRWVIGDHAEFPRGVERWLLNDGSIWVPGIIGQHNYERPYQAWAFALWNKHGGDMSEWPEDLRVREWPSSRTPTA